MKVITDHGVTSDYAQIACVDSEDLSKIIQKPSLLQDFQFIMGLLDKRGDHAVIIRLELTSPRNIHSYIKELLKMFKSVSWLHNNKFYTRRRS